MKQKSEDDILLANLAEAIVEYHKKAKLTAEDPFDLYTERVSSSFFSDEKLFRSRFIKGYHILLDALTDNRL